MTISTKTTAKTKAPSGGSGAVRAESNDRNIRTEAPPEKDRGFFIAQSIQQRTDP
jgi:hypothetical protein